MQPKRCLPSLSYLCHNFPRHLIPKLLHFQSVRCSNTLMIFYLFIYLQNYVFTYLVLAALSLCCCTRVFLQLLQRVGATSLFSAHASHCSGFSCSEHRLQAHGLQQLQRVGTVVAALGLQITSSAAVVHGLSCSVACGIFPDQGLKPCPLHCKGDS